MSSKHTSCYVTFIWCGCSRMPYPLQVLIWWGDFPCSRAKMSRRSVTLEELSSSAWARLRSYDPASKSAVHLFHLFHLFLRASADKPVHEHAAWSFRSLKMFYWERISEVLQVFQLSRGLCGWALCFHVISEQRGWQRNWKPSALRPLNSHSTCQRSAVCLKKKGKGEKKKAESWRSVCRGSSCDCISRNTHSFPSPPTLACKLGCNSLLVSHLQPHVLIITSFHNEMHDLFAWTETIRVTS